MSTEILKSKSVLLELFYFDCCASERVSIGTSIRHAFLPAASIGALSLSFFVMLYFVRGG